MNSETVELLEECTSGCKMALNSIEQIVEYAREQKLIDILSEYKDKHEQIKEEIGAILSESGLEEKQPGMMATAFSWMNAKAKLMLNDNSHEIAKIIMDGCNMGIQSLCEYQNKNTNADENALRLAKDLVKIEEDLMCEMKQFL